MASEPSMQQLMTENKILFNAFGIDTSGNEVSVLNCAIKFPDSRSSPEWQYTITQANTLIDLIEKEKVQLRMKGNKDIINEILGHGPPKAKSQQPPKAAPPANQPLKKTFRVTYPAENRPKDAPTSGSIKLSEGVTANWKVVGK